MRAEIVTGALLVGSLIAPDLRAGALDRFEKAHERPSSDDDRSSSSSSSSSSDDSSDGWTDDSSGGWTDDGTTDDDDATDPSMWRAFGAAFCLAPPFAFSCLHPMHRTTVKPYGGGLYIEPLESELGREPALFAHGTFDGDDWSRGRWFEMELTGFRAMNEDWILSHGLGLRAYFYNVVVSARWERLYELLETGTFDQLDLFRAHLGANVTGPFVDIMELYLHAGAAVLSGNSVTPAFDVGAELRLYPIDPLAVRASAMFSVFEIGPVLLDARLEAGVALDRFEVRAGPRVLYQGEAQGFWGPSASIEVRF